MAKVSIQVIEWKIENLSYWCEAVNGKKILSPESLLSCLERFNQMELYPRGGSGQDDRMGMRFCGIICDFIGELSYIGFDGTSIYTQQVKFTKNDEKVLGLSLGPKFEEVLAQIKSNTADRKDKLTLRISYPSEYNNVLNMCTAIGVVKVSFKIDSKFFESFESNKSRYISYTRYSSQVGKGMHIRIARENERMLLIMEPTDVSAENPVLVESCISMLSSDNFIVRNEEIKHVFINEDEWTFSESLKVKEIEEKDISLLLRLKIINGQTFQRYFHQIEDKKVCIVPNDRSINFSDLKSSESPVVSNQSDDSVTVLTKELMCLYQDQDFSDFQLKCGDISFPVHKNILTARSPVFKTMISSDMIETASGEVDIVDLDAPTLGRFLAFLYTGAVEDMMGQNALKLYYAADKYQVPSLKKECADFLCENISIENVCDVLTLADHHKDGDLTDVSHNFILKNYNEVLESNQWENFMKSDPMLALNTVTHFAKKRYVGKLPIP